MILALLVAMLSFKRYAQVKTEKEMKQEIKKMEELIQERLGMVSGRVYDREITACRGADYSRRKKQLQDEQKACTNGISG